YRAAPEQAAEARQDGAADRDAEPEGDRQSDYRPEHEGPVDEADHRILLQVGGKAVLAAALGVDEEPADVRVEEPLELGPDALAVAHVRAVRVALLIRERVVLAVVGDPGDHGALDRGGAERADDPAHDGTGLEAAMGEE